MGILEKMGMSFVCLEGDGVICFSIDPRNKERIWVFRITLNPGQFDSPSSLSSFDLDCSRYVYKMTYSEGFKDVYGKVSEYQNRGLMNSRSWAPIMPGSVLDMAGQLVCPAR